MSTKKDMIEEFVTFALDVMDEIKDAFVEEVEEPQRTTQASKKIKAEDMSRHKMDAECVKCGWIGARGSHALIEHVESSYFSDDEHILRQCTMCGYQWAERCKDHIANPPKDKEDINC